MIGDLGLACRLSPSSFLFGFCGTPGYVCLEAMTGERYSGGYQDVWALGWDKSFYVLRWNIFLAFAKIIVIIINGNYEDIISHNFLSFFNFAAMVSVLLSQGNYLRVAQWFAPLSVSSVSRRRGPYVPRSGCGIGRRVGWGQPLRPGHTSLIYTHLTMLKSTGLWNIFSIFATPYVLDIKHHTSDTF